MGGFSILGFLVNNTPHPVTEVAIRATLIFHSGMAPFWQEISLPYKHVLPSERVPFRIDFPAQPAPESVILEVVDFQVSGNEDGVLEVELTGNTITPEGEDILTGWISNSMNSPAQIHHLNLLAVSSSDEPKAMVPALIHPASILPHQRLPILFMLDILQDQDLVSFEPFIDATLIPGLDEPSLSFPQFPEIVFDPQGNLLLRGIIQNTEPFSRWISAEITLLFQDQMVSVASLKPPSPLGPGETRGFGLTNFPGWRERLDELNGQPEDLSFEIFFDPMGCGEFNGQIVSLSVEMTSFESTGSTLFIKGSAYNPSSYDLSSPAIHAEVRSTRGILQTSNWILLDEILAQGQNIDFILAIRLPEGIQLPETEIDITGTAVSEEDALPF
jgi:hypothetical protein